MGKTVSIFNQKGGVGKTTTCVSFAACLGHKGKNTLLVDCDPQGNSTSGVGIDKSQIEASSYDVLINDISVKDAIIKTKYKKSTTYPWFTRSIRLPAAPGMMMVRHSSIDTYRFLAGSFTAVYTTKKNTAKATQRKNP